MGCTWMMHKDTNAPACAEWCGVLFSAARMDFRIAAPYAPSYAFWAAEHLERVSP
jgi:hypothetical protein